MSKAVDPEDSCDIHPKGQEDHCYEDRLLPEARGNLQAVDEDALCPDAPGFAPGSHAPDEEDDREDHQHHDQDVEQAHLNLPIRIRFLRK